MKTALVLTVKNEARLLRDNLRYHRAIGVDHIFVYFDGTTDLGKESISDLDFVTISNSVTANTYQSMKFLEKFTSKASEHHTARQCLNTYDALMQCKVKGYDWLLSLDADELLCTHGDQISDLAAFFSSVPNVIDVVTFQTREVLTRQLAYTNVFAEETLFKTQPSFGGRFQNIYKELYNPFTHNQERYSYWYGQHLGKAAIRVSSGLIPHNVHRYRHKDGSKPAQVQAGFVLHYHIYDATDFIKKFTNFSNRPDTYLSGNRVKGLKLLLRDVVNGSGMNASELTTYFKENLLFSQQEVRRLLQNRYLWFLKRDPAPLESITSVQQVFESKIDKK